MTDVTADEQLADLEEAMRDVVDPDHEVEVGQKVKVPEQPRDRGAAIRRERGPVARMHPVERLDEARDRRHELEVGSVVGAACHPRRLL